MEGRTQFLGEEPWLFQAAKYPPWVLSGFEVGLLLIGEGQHSFTPDAPSIGLELANYGVSIGRAVKTLASDGEMQSIQKPLTLEIINSVGPASIAYLLDLRRRWISRQTLQGWEERRGCQPWREIAAKGIFTPTDFMDADRLRALFVERIANRPAGTNAFAILPIGLLSGSYSHPSRTPDPRCRGDGNRIDLSAPSDTASAASLHVWNLVRLQR